MLVQLRETHPKCIREGAGNHHPIRCPQLNPQQRRTLSRTRKDSPPAQGSCLRREGRPGCAGSLLLYDPLPTAGLLQAVQAAPMGLRIPTGLGQWGVSPASREARGGQGAYPQTSFPGDAQWRSSPHSLSAYRPPRIAVNTPLWLPSALPVLSSTLCLGPDRCTG